MTPATGPAYVRNPAISATEIDAETFLVRPSDGEVFYLDEISSALWRFLSEPRRDAEIVEVFHAAFPGVSDAQIAHDIRVAIEDMTARGLIARLDPMSP